MIKQILKIIWVQRRTNGWIFAELLVVMCAVWWMADRLYVDLKTYYTPLGFDITNTWLFNVKQLTPDSPGYVPEDQIQTTRAEDLQQLVQHLRMNSSVDKVGVAFTGQPYNTTFFYNSIEPVGGDTTKFRGQWYKIQQVTPEFFDVFNFTDIHGKALGPQFANIPERGFIITAGMAKHFFGDVDTKGRELKFPGGDEIYPVIAVTSPVRPNEFEKDENAYYNLMSVKSQEGFIEAWGANSMNICVRMKKAFTQDDMDRFMEEMGPRLQVNNLKIYTLSSFDESRKMKLKTSTEQLSKNVALMVFLLINIFFGVIGTFWLKTQHRQGELGLRVALGASKWNLKEYIYLEGLSLLLLTIPFTLAFALNMMFLDVLDTFRQPLTAVRFLITYGGSYLLMIGMIGIGIWFPVRKVSKMAPAEALHYE